jgi:hypothetical protein
MWLPPGAPGVTMLTKHLSQSICLSVSHKNLRVFKGHGVAIILGGSPKTSHDFSRFFFFFKPRNKRGWKLETGKIVPSVYPVRRKSQPCTESHPQSPG